MLCCLRIRDFAVVEEVEIVLGPGLNVLTGETGAGKSIVVSALELVLGGRTQADVVRTGAAQAEVEALFSVEDDRVRERLRDHGVTEPDEFIVRRVVPADGRSRTYLDGRLISTGKLADLTADLADITSQHEYHSLASIETHLALVDGFTRLDPLRRQMAAAYGQLKGAYERLQDFQQRVRSRAEREELLRFVVKEIEDLAPLPNEDTALGAERDRLRHAEQLVTAAGNAEDALYAGDAAVCEVIGRITNELERAGRVDPSLGRHVAPLREAAAQIEDAARELGRYARDIQMDPSRLAEIEERIDRLGRVKRKYGPTLDEVIAYGERAHDELRELGSHEETYEALEAELARAQAEAETIARTLSAQRQAGARDFSAAVSDELRTLGMGDATVTMEIDRLEGQAGELGVDGARLTAQGMDRAELLIAPNRGESARPLRRIASGGELSRALLAVKHVLADVGSSGLYVFDEVDAGVGGGVAEVIGRKLKDIARHHQVLCITHLPQIAVYADAHLRVHKEVVDGRTRSGIARLDDDARREEIARMLGGLTITRKTRATADEMLRAASPHRSPKSANLICARKS